MPWWLIKLFILVPVAAVIDFAADCSTGVKVASYLLLVPALWIEIASDAKRYHDRNKSGWWQLISLVPFIGKLCLLVELGFMKGTRGANRYGHADVFGREAVVAAERMRLAEQDKCNVHGVPRR